LKESTIQVVVQHLRELEDNFWGTFSVRLRGGQAAVIVKEETLRLDEDKPHRTERQRH